MAKLRTFIAVDVSDRVRKRALDLIERLRPTPARVNWVGPTELHWTLKFLGDVAPRELPDLCAAMDRAVSEVAPFDIEALGAGAFPAAARPRTVWLGVGSGAEQFIDLHDRIEEQLVPLGFRTEQRRFRPHLTLGRVRRSPEGIEELGALIALQADYSGGVTEVSEVVLYSSRLERRGPTYEVLGRHPLGAAS